MIILFVSLFVLGAVFADPASNQLPNFKKRTRGPIGILTTTNGAPVEVSDLRALNSNLLTNDFLIETLSHQSRERIPERVVHTKGAGAFGYFEVTHNITNICKAKLFSEIGKQTPVVVRFSQTAADKGEADTNRDGRGFAVKFYTEEGNLDIIGIHLPLFPIKELIFFGPLGRVLKRNPVTNLKDSHMFWDFMSFRPESVSFILLLFGDNGIPDGYRYMSGFPIHTYQVYNKFGESYFVRFHIIPDQGVRNLFAEKAFNLTALDPDYAVRDLYNAIENRDYPSWTISLQVLTAEDVKKAKFDVFDITKMLPEDQYPLQPVGKLVLNRNPKNFYADVEQVAFAPSNVVPGVMGSPDDVYTSRRFAYKDAQRYRLGVNHDKIRVNCPYASVYSYNRDGRSPVGANGGDGPNYFPNSYHGPVPYVDKYRPKLVTIKQYDDSYNFEQVAEIYRKMSEEERKRLVENLVRSLKQVNKELQWRVIGLFELAHVDLAYRVTMGLAAV